MVGRRVYPFLPGAANGLAIGASRRAIIRFSHTIRRMAKRVARPSAPPRSQAWLGWLVLAACAVAGVVWAMWPRGMAWTAARGVELLSRAERPGDAVALLAQWEAETGPTWSQQPDAFTDFLLNRRPLDDARVRALVTFMSGCDYGPRMKDWDRWRRNRERLAEGRDPYAARSERVR